MAENEFALRLDKDFMPTMIKWIGLLCATLCLFACAPEDKDPFGGPSLSHLGRALLAERTDAWHHAESRHMIYHARSKEMVGAVHGPSEFAYRKIGAFLGPRDSGRLHLFVVEDQAVWTRLIQGGQRRKDSLSLQHGGEIYVLRNEASEQQAEDLFHEMAHARLWVMYKNTLPLWLEEGVAVFWGGEAALDYYASPGMTASRLPPTARHNEWMDWERLTRLEEYPEDSDQVRIFYHQAGVLVRRLLEEIGHESFSVFIRETSHNPEDWKEAWQNVSGWDGEKIEVFLETIESGLNGTDLSSIWVDFICRKMGFQPVTTARIRLRYTTPGHVAILLSLLNP